MHCIYSSMLFDYVELCSDVHFADRPRLPLHDLHPIRALHGLAEGEGIEHFHTAFEIMC